MRKHMARRRKRKREKGGASAADPAAEPAEQGRVPATAADASDAPTASDELAPFQVGLAVSASSPVSKRAYGNKSLPHSQHHILAT